MRKQVKQGRRRRKVAKATGGRDQSRQQINGETLRSAVTWIVNEKSFENLRFHGNTKWLMCDLIILAVLWVWSDHATLTGSVCGGSLLGYVTNSFGVKTLAA